MAWTAATVSTARMEQRDKMAGTVFQGQLALPAGMESLGLTVRKVPTVREVAMGSTGLTAQTVRTVQACLVAAYQDRSSSSDPEPTLTPYGEALRRARERVMGPS